MAEVVTGAMGSLLPKLADLITEEYSLQRGVRGEIMFLKAEMESMQTALLKISQAPIDQPPDIQVKLWAKAVRDLSYDLEDSIDKFMVHIETHGQDNSRSFKGFIDKSLSLLTKGKIRHKIGIDIKGIKTRIKEVSERRDRCRVDSVAIAKPTGPTIDTLRLSALYRKSTELVGTDQKSVEVVKMLMQGDEVSNRQLKVVSIVGLGGLGKTTLANAVYEKLKEKFNIQKKNQQFDFSAAFVSVSLNPSMEKIFKNLLYQLDKQKYENINEATWGEAQLISEIRAFLRNRRYLIVTDDIWDKSVWENIKYALPENEYGSKVITTTRILDVAQQADDVYRLEPLSIVDSRKLFYQRIYEAENKSPPNHLVEISEKVLGRCGGVPLAILTIASLLSSKKGRSHTHEYWSKVYKSMGSGLDNSHDDVKNMRRILSVSYSDLPPHLKTCILHLSLYPEDYEIQTEELIWKWVGEGFVKNEQGRSLYEEGEDYFNELINKSLVQPVKFDNANKVCSCCVHDMVRDLITSLSTEENFLTTFGGQQPVYLPGKIRRLSIHTCVEGQLPTIGLTHVRSLSVSSPAFCLLPALSGFPVLRVLDLTDCKQVDNNHWKDICSLFHLRYLNLKGTSVTKIPQKIGNLQFLQVLDIRSTRIEEELPSTFIQLTRLLLFHMLDSITFAVPRWMCSMSFLFSLSITLETLGEEDLQVLGSIPSLSELLIQVKKPTQGRDKRLHVGSGYPFPCLTRFIFKSDTMELRFERGAMQSLQSLWLNFEDVQDTLLQFGDFILGLENLSSLEHIYVCFRKGNDTAEEMQSVRNSVQKEMDMNRKKPILMFPLTLEEEIRRQEELRRKAALKYLNGTLFARRQ
ncbi:disease resistance protein Pik-2 isoform X2 [Triticum aestivum]|uniref:disease resistance protein Pik-2 isoform X2 n=1 Tax=Triticum aestivum TaxID=4565 RepID=UPI001D024092|nr:disease resistance protein Pik-2-like isoform X2 [Triticum aestivum]